MLNFYYRMFYLHFLQATSLQKLKSYTRRRIYTINDNQFILYVITIIIETVRTLVAFNKRLFNFFFIKLKIKNRI